MRKGPQIRSVAAGGMYQILCLCRVQQNHGKALCEVVWVFVTRSQRGVVNGSMEKGVLGLEVATHEGSWAWRWPKFQQALSQTESLKPTLTYS